MQILSLAELKQAGLGRSPAQSAGLGRTEALTRGRGGSLRPLAVMYRCLCAALSFPLLLLISAHAFAQKPELVVQTGHSKFVTVIAFSADGRLLASGSQDYMIKLWDVATGRELRTLSGHRDQINSLVFSRDGRLLASASGGEDLAKPDITVRVWDVATGRMLQKFEGNNPAFSPDGRTIAYGDEKIRLRDAVSGGEVRTIAGTYPIAFSPAGKTILGVEAGKLKLWDVAAGSELRTYDGLPAAPFSRAGFSPDGRMIAGTVTDAPGRRVAIKVVDTATGQELRRIEGDWPFAFTPDGAALACSVQRDKLESIVLWDLTTGAELRTLIAPSNPRGISIGDDRGPVMTAIGPSELHGNIAFSPDGKALASGAGFGAIKLWDTASGEVRRVLRPHSVAVPSVAFSGDGRMLVTGSDGELWGDNAVKLWDLTGNGAMRALAGHRNSPVATAFSPDSATLASGGNDQTVRLWDSTAGGRRLILTGTDLNANALAFSPDGRMVAAGRGGSTGNPFNMGIQVTEYSQENPIDIWDVASGKWLLKLPGHRSMVHAVVFSPDGRTLVSGAGFSQMETALWDTATGTKIRTLPGMGLAFSSDGKTLAVANDDNVIELWDAATGAKLHTLEGSASPAAFSPDGKFLATGGADNSIRLWDVATATESRALAGHTNSVTSLAFNPDGNILASGSLDARTKLWEVTTGRELATLVALDQKEWLVATPDGLFDGSPTALNQILWRFNQNTFEVAPVEIFFSEFFRPNLLADLFSGRRPTARQAVDQKDRRQPRLSLSPADGAGSGAREMKVRIEITDAPAGARDVRLFRNGSLVRVWRGEVLKGSGHLTVETTVPIMAGENQLTAYAFNHDNIKSSDATLTISGTDSLRRAGTAYVLAVGIDNYANSQFNLRYAVADAEAFSAEWRDQQEKLGRYKQVEVVPLYNENATKAGILRALATLARQAQPEDVVVIYFAGHGTAQQSRFYLIPHDLGYTGARTTVTRAGLQRILAHGISDRELEQAVERIDAGQLLLVIDACNSGQALEAEEKRRGPMNSKGLAQLAYEKGMYILTAAQSYQAALEASQLGHGYLTYALVTEGLRQGAADREPKDGVVMVREWFNFAAERVPQMQQKEMRARLLRQENVTFVEGEEKIKDANRRSVQRPRVFYRRELEANPIIVARPQAAAR
ncbi:MAG TPA: caspase family protein [Blastocatellia bacterium]|nr:caspase family protein [Blastocatellia bacterium]